MRQPPPGRRGLTGHAGQVTPHAASFSVRSFWPAYQVATTVTAASRTVAVVSPTSEVIAPEPPTFSATARDHCWTLSVRAPGTSEPNSASHTSA